MKDKTKELISKIENLLRNWGESNKSAEAFDKLNEFYSKNSSVISFSKEQEIEAIKEIEDYEKSINFDRLNEFKRVLMETIEKNPNHPFKEYIKTFIEYANSIDKLLPVDYNFTNTNSSQWLVDNTSMLLKLMYLLSWVWTTSKG